MLTIFIFLVSIEAFLIAAKNCQRSKEKDSGELKFNLLFRSSVSVYFLLRDK